MDNKETVKAFKALGHQTRLSIIKELQKATHLGLQPIHLLENIKVSFPTLSFHLKKLENANLITSRKRGLQVFYRINAENLNQIIQQIS